MAEPFISELRIFSFSFAPRGWAQCNGQLLPINQNQALFSLLGTTYGGDGRITFALPNLQARVPIHEGDGFVLGQSGGETSHTLTLFEMPTHTHMLVGNTATASSNTPSPTARLANDEPGNLYGPANNLLPMHAAAISSAGGSQPHQNAQPYLALNICIALVGIFPSRN